MTIAGWEMVRTPDAIKPARREGFSLLEVLLATSILLGCLVVLAELASIGRQHATDAQDLTAAQLICQTKLNEILAGASPVRSVQNRVLEDAPGWVYSVEIEPLDQPGLALLRVTVSEESDELQEAADQRHLKQFALVRWIRDPYRQGTSSAGSGLAEKSLLGRGFGGD